jgi:putative hemolysin
MINSVLLLAGFVFLVFIAGLFAGSETGLYQMSRLRLRLGVERKRMGFVILGKAMHDGPALLLTLLIGTNLSYYLATSIVTNAFLGKVNDEHTAEVFATLVTVPILFVFAELIPKNVFFYRADVLMPSVSPILYGVNKILSWSGAIRLLRFISTLFGRLVGLSSSSKTVIASAQRHHVKAILQDTGEEGILSSVQADIINRIAGVSNMQIKSVMVAFNKVQTADVNTDRSSLMHKLKASAFTRLPVYEGQPTNIVGFVNVLEAFTGPEQFADLRGFVRPIRRLDAGTAVTDAINLLQRDNERIVLVTTPTGAAARERPVGIVTMKDLVEELLGELAEW